MVAIYVLAIFLGMLSYSMLNVGMGLQKKGASSLPKINNQSLGQNLKNFFTNKTWLLGFLLIQAQWVFLVMALDFAPISMITPLMSVGMVALVLFSYFYLKEPISKVEIIGIILIIAGIVVLGVTNPEEEVQHDFNFIRNSLGKAESIIFLTVIFVLSIVFVLISIARKFKNADILFGLAAGITDALGAILIKALMGGADFRDREVLSANVGRWEWWFILITMIIFNTVATIYLQVAYQRGKAVIVAPVFSVLAMIMPVFAGIIIFNDWAIFIDQNLIGKLVGKLIALLVIIIGAIILSIYSARIENKRKLDELNYSEKTNTNSYEIIEETATIE